MADITAKDIAAQLGLSSSAVSLALNGKPGVSEKTRAQVLALAAKLGYLPRSSSAVNAARRKTICFVFFVDSIVSIAEHTSFSSFLLKGVESAATTLGYNTMIRYFYAGKPSEQQISDLLDVADGIILLGTDITTSSLREIETFINLANSIPIVITDNFLLSDKVDCVGSDNLAGARIAVSYLLQQGFQSIGYLRSRQRIESFDVREIGYRAALEKVGGTLAPVVDVGISSESAFLDFDRWLDTSPQLPRAFIAENDVVAVSAIRALTRRGVRIPEQVAILGYDDIPICNMVSPPLTTVRVNKELIGWTAVNALHMRLSSGSTTLSAQQTGLVKIMLSTKLIERESTARAPR